MTAVLAAGHRVRAFARSASKIEMQYVAFERFARGATRTGDVEAALGGVDVVVEALGVPFRDLFGRFTQL